MPWTSVDSLPEAVKTFLKNHGASMEQMRQWMHVANSCMSRGMDEGRCIRMANGVLSKRFGRNYLNVNAIDVSKIREETVDGKPAYILPTVYTREGVQLRRFKPWPMLSKSSPGIVGIPVSFMHPPKDSGGIFSTPQIIIGKTLKSENDDDNKRVLGEIALWKGDPRVEWLLSEVRQGRHLDGSVAFWSKDTPKQGQYNGIPYEAEEEIRFWDHYAVGIERGACSSAQGCGLLQNQDCECVTLDELDMEQNCEDDPEPCLDSDVQMGLEDYPLTARELWYNDDEEYWHDSLKDEYNANAVLTAAARKALPSSAFCGPDRSFPAHDAAHVRNGLARLPQSKRFSPDQKARIRACLVRKAKRFGVETTNIEEDLYNGEDIRDTGELNMSETPSTPSAGTSPETPPAPAPVPAVFPASTTPGMISSLEAVALRQRIEELEKEVKKYRDNEARRIKEETESLRAFVKKITANSIPAEEVEKMDKEQLELVAKAMSGRTDFALKGTYIPREGDALSRNEFGQVYSKPSVGNLYKPPKREGD